MTRNSVDMIFDVVVTSPIFCQEFTAIHHLGIHRQISYFRHQKSSKSTWRFFTFRHFFRDENIDQMTRKFVDIIFDVVVTSQIFFTNSTRLIISEFIAKYPIFVTKKARKSTTRNVITYNLQLHNFKLNSLITFNLIVYSLVT